LDDLFNFAAGNSAAGIEVAVQANVTTNQTGGLLTEQTNTAATPPALLLVYVPFEEGGVLRPPFPASFQGQGLNIKAPLPFARSDTYSIDWQGNAFTATVDGTTNIVYGAAGQQFITISLCNLAAITISQ
jgi:hypothetical protein